MKTIAYAVVGFLFCCLVAGGVRGAVTNSGDVRYVQNDDSEETANGMYFNGDLYTEYYVRDMLLAHIWQPDGSPDNFATAYFGSGKAGDPHLPRKIQTFTNDPDHVFIMECESLLFDERLYRKTSFELPDYLDEKTTISKVIVAMDDDDADENTRYVTFQESQEVQQLMQTIRDAVRISSQHPEQMNSVDVKTAKYSCYVEFEGISGRLYVGFVCKDGNGKWCFSAYETDYSSGLDGFKSIALPESLQNWV